MIAQDVEYLGLAPTFFSAATLPQHEILQETVFLHPQHNAA